jgi:hypothetical protein
MAERYEDAKIKKIDSSDLKGKLVPGAKHASHP